MIQTDNIHNIVKSGNKRKNTSNNFFSKKLLIFAGTTEGRQLIEYLINYTDILITACTATEYGKILLPVSEHLSIISRRLDENAIYELICTNSFDAVIDTTHPYAVLVTENIKNAAKKAHLNYIRLVRPTENISNIDKTGNINELCETYATDSTNKTYTINETDKKINNIINAASVKDAIEYLKKTTGNILSTTGSKELSEFCRLDNYKERVYARILPNPDMVRVCYDAGFTGRHLICMQGPFSEEMNIAIINQYNIKYTVTKNSGRQGGFMEKVNSAMATDTKLIIIGRPVIEEGLTYEQVIEWITTDYL